MSKSKYSPDMSEKEEGLCQCEDCVEFREKELSKRRKCGDCRFYHASHQYTFLMECWHDPPNSIGSMERTTYGNTSEGFEDHKSLIVYTFRARVDANDFCAKWEKRDD